MDWLTFFSTNINSLAWPIVVIVALLVLKRQIINLNSARSCGIPSAAPSSVNVTTGTEEVQQPLPLPWWKFWLGAPETVLARATVLLAIATGLLAAIAVGQAWILATTDASTRKAAEAAVKSATSLDTALKTVRQNFRTEQRPILWLTNEVEAPRFLNVGDNIGRIAWNWRYINYGKTPALKITYNEFLGIHGKPEPNAGEPTPAAPVPTNKSDFSTIVSQPTMTLEQFKELLQIENDVGISVNIKYEDAYGEKYETDFCLYKLAAGAIAYCKEGNDIK